MAETRFNPNINHPPKGSSIKVEPITDLKAIRHIKKLLKDKPRNLCLFIFGINTGYRASELLSLTVGQVAHLKVGDRLDLKQSKNRKYRPATMNEDAITAIQNWLPHHPNPQPDAPLFVSQIGGKAITKYQLIALVKDWCRQAELNGHYGSHTLRKTWGYHKRKTHKKDTAVISVAYGHASERQTLEYLCIQPEEIDDLYTQGL